LIKINGYVCSVETFASVLFVEEKEEKMFLEKFLKERNLVLLNLLLHFLRRKN